MLSFLNLNRFSSLDSSWHYGLGSLAALLLPWVVLPHSLFLWVLLIYTAGCMLGLTLICLLMTGRELIRAWRGLGRPQPAAPARHVGGLSAS